VRGGVFAEEEVDDGGVVCLAGVGDGGVGVVVDEVDVGAEIEEERGSLDLVVEGGEN